MKSLILLSTLGLMAAATDTPTAGGAAKPETKPKLVKVKVLCGSLGEGAEYYKKDDTFETTKERAEALGDLVQIV